MTIRASVRVIAQAFLLIGLLMSAGAPAMAAQYAAMVVDARSGKVLHSRNADTRLHPASLTKMMTLYIAFDAVERGEISLDSVVTISKRAAAEPPSKLGLKAGQKIRFRYLIRAAAVKSANDAATAIGEALSGSEAAFARRMNRTAQALGMSRTTFKNAHGLTEGGHLSTARDMTTLGRHLFYDFPRYYNLFSRRVTDAGVKPVYNTNRKLLAKYRGADGIKTGYTRAAGYNLVASAERGSERVIATVFGGRSTATRNARVAELLDMGFQRAPSRVAIAKPRRPDLSDTAVASASDGTGGVAAGKTIRMTGLVTKSLRPATRPGASTPDDTRIVALQNGIADALAEVAVASTVAAQPVETPATAPVAIASLAARAIDAASAETPTEVEPVSLAPIEAPSVLSASLAGASLRPAPRPVEEMGSDAPDVVTRVSTSGGRNWGVNVGRFTTRQEAEKKLLETALVEMSSLADAFRKVELSSKGWEANFVGLSEAQADLACRRLEAQNLACRAVGPS